MALRWGQKVRMANVNPVALAIGLAAGSSLNRPS